MALWHWRRTRTAVAEPGTPPAAEALVADSLAALGWPPAVGEVVLLAGGRSGAQVFLVETASRRVVLKVTEDPGWRRPALRELAVYQTEDRVRAAFRPRLLAAQDDGAAVRLLLAAHEPYPPARELGEDDWLAVAAGLGQLHRLPLPPGRWPGPPGRPTSQAVAAALREWDRHGWSGVAARAARRLAAATGTGPGPVLAHGDCHVGNLVRGPGGRPCWVDWQEACLGSGLGDLVFLWQRAEFDGARPPRTAMTSTYAGARGVRLDDGLRSALDGVELRLPLLSWPAFLGYGSGAGRQVMGDRLAELASRTDPGRAPTARPAGRGPR
ncbi:hypothetical protein GCM10009616_24440 [Microlunatus lacustris]